MFCVKCGQELKPGAKFCTKCGAPVSKAQMNAENPVEINRSEPKQMHTKASKQKKTLVGLIVILALLLVLGGGLAVYYFAGNTEIGEDLERMEDVRDDNETGQEPKEPSEEENVDMETESVESVIPETRVVETEVATKEQSQYILPTSNSEYLTMEDLEGLTATECRVARNELYARHGRMFTDEALQAYFDSRDWYVGSIAPEDFDESVLNEYEFANRDLIVVYEEEKGYR